MKVDDQKLARLQQLEWAVEWFAECVEAGQFLQARAEDNSNFVELLLGLDPWHSCYKEWKATYNQAWQDVLETMS